MLLAATVRGSSRCEYCSVRIYVYVALRCLSHSLHYSIWKTMWIRSDTRVWRPYHQPKRYMASHTIPNIHNAKRNVRMYVRIYIPPLPHNITYSSTIHTFALIRHTHTHARARATIRTTLVVDCNIPFSSIEHNRAILGRWTGDQRRFISYSGPFSSTIEHHSAQNLMHRTRSRLVCLAFPLAITHIAYINTIYVHCTNTDSSSLGFCSFYYCSGIQFKNTSVHAHVCLKYNTNFPRKWNSPTSSQIHTPRPSPTHKTESQSSKRDTKIEKFALCVCVCVWLYTTIDLQEMDILSKCRTRYVYSGPCTMFRYGLALDRGYVSKWLVTITISTAGAAAANNNNNNNNSLPIPP